jgi:hypothetical protein
LPLVLLGNLADLPGVFVGQLPSPENHPRLLVVMCPQR